MGADGIDADSIWMPTGTDVSAIVAGSGGSRGRTGVRILVALLCFALAAGAGWLLLRDDGGSSERLVGKATSRTPKPIAGATPTKSSSTSTSTTMTIVPSTLPLGATVKCGGWDAAFNGTPEITADGITIFSDFDGWHVRAKGATFGPVTGKISGVVQPNLYGTVDNQRVNAAPVPGELAVSFTITPGTEPEGFDFSAGCAQKALRFEISVAGAPIDPKLVHLGTHGGVLNVPFEANRAPEKTG